MADQAGEYRAAIVLALCLPKQFFGQVFSGDKPDLHFINGNIGVEVTRAMSKESGEIIHRIRDIYKNDMSRSKKSVERLEKLGYTACEKNGKAATFHSKNGFIPIGDMEALDRLKGKTNKSKGYKNTRDKIFTY